MAIPEPARPSGVNAPASHAALALALGVAVTLTPGKGAYARDILRGGGAVKTSAASVQGSNAANAASAQSAAIAARAKDTLRRTTQALQALQSLQRTARAAAAASSANNLGADPNHTGKRLADVINGLGEGGLVAGASWTGASLPAQSSYNGKTLVTVTQKQQQAILNWESFNVGKETTLYFNQSAGGSDVGDWIAFNKVASSSGSPSQILGSIKAEGQVYIINQNGIIFGGSSQVNVHALVASSLPINDNLISRGLVDNPDLQFLFSSIEVPKLASGTMEPFTPPAAPNTEDGLPGDVVVRAGAQISSPTSADHVGGKVALIGTNVTNAGTISTPDGQTILAAGQQVAFLAHASSDPSLRGLDVYVGQDGGTAENSGVIEAYRGSITMVGKAVNQLGALESTTSVSLNGRIDLLASYNTVQTTVSNKITLVNTASGSVTLGEGSVTRILPETDSDERVAATSLALGSQINIQGATVYLASNAAIKAPSAAVTIRAGLWSLVDSAYSFAYSSGNIYLDAGSVIDVSGSEDVSVSLDENILKVQLLGAEFADYPTQRNGILRGTTVTVDARRGLQLADISGYIALIERSVGELTVNGGSVTLSAGGSVVLQNGSKIDVSGGWLNYEGGTVKTTRLISGGHLYEISNAAADLVYDSVYSGFTTTHSRWGITKTYTSSLLSGEHYESSYLSGGAGGSIAITAAGMALDGDLYGNTVTGPRQLSDTESSSSSLALTFKQQVAGKSLFTSPTPPKITFSNAASQTAADAFTLDIDGNAGDLREDRLEEVILSTSLVNSNGFGRLSIDNSDGDIVVPTGVTLLAAAAGSITLEAANIDIQGQITVPGGSLTLKAYDISPYTVAAKNASSNVADRVTPDADTTRGLLTLGSSATLSTAGLTVDNRVYSSTAETRRAVVNGGSITLEGYNVELFEGGAIDASGGVLVAANGRRTYGSGGSVSISAGRDLNITSVLGGNLVLGSTLEAYGGLGTAGGKLTLSVPALQIGGSSTASGEVTLLSTAFFNEGGFSSFTLKGTGIADDESGGVIAGVTVASSTVLEISPQSRIAWVTPSSIDFEAISLPEGVRPTVSLTLNASGANDYFSGTLLVRGDEVIGEGAQILAGAKGSVTLSGATVSVLGGVWAPGGSINVSGASNSSTLFDDPDNPQVTVELGSASVLSTAGATLVVPDGRGRNTGSVLDGGSIKVSGNIAASSGALLDVSGASGTLDMAASAASLGVDSNGSLKGAVYRSTEVESNGGSITLDGGQALFVDATLLGEAGGASAQGGSLTVSSGVFVSPNSSEQLDRLDSTLTVTQSGLTLTDWYYSINGSAIGRTIEDARGNAVKGMGYFTADRFNNGGFSSLTLPGTINFSGPVTLTASYGITVGIDGSRGGGGVIYADGAVRLNAPYVALGTAYTAPVDASQVTAPFMLQGVAFPAPPTYGTGSLHVNATLVDVGNLSLQSIGSVSIVADHGDIRGYGTLDVAGDISLQAGQIYPVTASTFTLAAFDYTKDGEIRKGSVKITGSGSRSLPLSAGGTLNIYGSVITQGGVVRAPMGTINIGWDGSGTAIADLLSGRNFAVTTQLTLGAGSITSVSAVDPSTGEGITIPYGLSKNGTSWIDPTGTDISSTGAPQKSVHLSAQNLDDEAGSSIDIRGGGDLYAYQWINGNGGRADILDTSSSFAVIPGYSASSAPYAAFNGNPTDSTTLNGDTGYTSSTLKAGDQVYIAAGSGLPEGVYTLLPARYALLSGAYLITPKSGVATAATTLSDGASLVAGYRFNGLNSGQSAKTISYRFEVASSTVVRARAEYTDFSANSYFSEKNSNWRTPKDAGSLVLEATESLALLGRVNATSISGGRGGLVDISSPVDILIGGSGTVAGESQLFLDAATLSAFGAESLLIGGIRTTGSSGVTVTVNTNNLTVDNAGSALSGAEIILVANRTLTLEEGAQIEQTGSLAQGAETLWLGNASAAGSGDGLLVRVSGDSTAEISRSGISSSSTALLTVAAGVKLTGESLILDSSADTSLDSNAVLAATAVSLNSGLISLKLDESAVLPERTGLLLSGATLQTLEANVSLFSLVSYSSIDIYGAGEIGSRKADGTPVLESLSLRAGAIRGFQTGGGTTSFSARTIRLDNKTGVSAASSAQTPSGTLAFYSEKLRLADGAFKISLYDHVTLNASTSISAKGTGSLTTGGSLKIVTPVFTGESAATYTLTAGGAVQIQDSGVTASGAETGGLGASLTVVGTSIDVSSDISLPSGLLTLHATTGDINISGNLDVDGSEQDYFDVTKVTDGGKITLQADAGNVRIKSGGSVSISAPEAGGDAGSLSVSAPGGSFIVSGSLLGQAGYNGDGGTFSLDTATLAGGSMAWLDALLNQGGFTLSRTVRVRSGDVAVDSYAKARTYDLSADAGSISVTGSINASGDTGGTIRLQAFRGVTLALGASLSVAAVDFDSAGKGGSVSLETRGDGGALIDIQAGSLIDLTVAANTATSQSEGNFTGTLHLRAPQNAAGTDLQIDTIEGTILGASSIIAEGFKVYTPAGGSIDSVKSAILSDGKLFVGASGAASAGYSAMLNRLLGTSVSVLESIFLITPGAEVVNQTGNLTLGTASSDTSSDWNLATYRFGPKSVAGVLTLRAAGDLILYNTISDGFVSAAYNSLLLAQNTDLPANAQSWSYRFVAGADFTAADFRRVLPLASLSGSSGSIQLGKNGKLNVASSTGSGAQTSSALSGKYQVIRTGSGDIDIVAGRDLQLLNAFASIYTVGTQVVDPTLGGTFDVPVLDESGGETVLGSVQQNPAYPAQYTYAGGNVTVSAQHDIIHQTRNTAGTLIDDSQRELPINWLYRRGYVDSATGEFGTAKFGDLASTTWWVDFSNFFEGIGTLGGGNVILDAGHDVNNVDAVAATNARMSKGTPDAATLVELGGGDVTVRAGNDISGGVYYVERGKGKLSAGNSIHTNSTRSPSLTTIKPSAANSILAEETWLPTTLFLGKGSFDVEARGDLLLGPTVNAFLLPEGYNNTIWYKTYFSTYADDSSVNVSSLTGAVTLRAGTTLGGVNSSAVPILQAWFQNVLLWTTNPESVSNYQPWLRLNENNVAVFSTLFSLMPSTLNVTAYTGDIDVIGRILLSPSKTGNLELIAGGSINGLQPTGRATLSGVSTKIWSAGSINVSDADPSSVPGIETPYAYQTVAGTVAGKARQTGLTFFAAINELFAETGATSGSNSSLATRQALHSSGLLHLLDTDPVRIYAGGGDISGLTVYTPKFSRILASEDIADIALYLQNLNSGDVSVVAAGGDLVAYKPDTSLRVSAQTLGNAINYTSGALSGDIWIGGPGTLEVLAGGDLDLGIGPNNSNGTGLGILSIGNTRNPYLSFTGADIIAGAGIGIASSLASSQLDIAGFVSAFLDPATGGDQAARYLPSLGEFLDLTGSSNSEIWDAYRLLGKERQAELALEIFYLVLRDSGRDLNDSTSPGYGQNYAAGYAAIKALFPGDDWKGDISLTSREIKTKNGGNISLFAPGGKLTVGYDLSGNQALDQGILTESGGNISIFTHGDVIVGTSRIFTLRGGNEIIWSTKGDIAAGASSKTVQSAPPTRVMIDSQSADVQTDLAGLATGGGIGVLTTVSGVEPGDVDLIAPEGTIDAGDAGIRVSGNLNVSALKVLNTSNIQVGGVNTGAASTVTVQSTGNLAVNANSTAATTKSAETFVEQQSRTSTAQTQEIPSLISVEVLGYGGGEDDAPAPAADEDSKKNKNEKTE